MLDNPPVNSVKKRSEKRAAHTSRRAARRRKALSDTSASAPIITNTIMTDLSLISSLDSNSSMSMSINDPRLAIPDELIALETLAEWNARPISHRPQIEQVATFISELYLSLPYGTTDITEITLSSSNCTHLYRAFHSIRKEFLFAALHTALSVQSTITCKSSGILLYFKPLGDKLAVNEFDSPTGHDLKTYYGNIFNHVSTIRSSPVPPRAALSVLLCDLAAFLHCHRSNIQIYRSAIMTELLDGFIIYLTKMLGQPALTDLYDIKRQLYESRLLNRFSEHLMHLLDDHAPLNLTVNTKCQPFNLELHGIKELAPFCFDADARLVRVAPNTKLNKLAPRYFADIIKDNDVFCTFHNIPYFLFVTRTSPFTSRENLLTLIKPESDT